MLKIICLSKITVQSCDLLEVPVPHQQASICSGGSGYDDTSKLHSVPEGDDYQLNDSL